ncbi:MAG: methylase [Chloroflexi bacterium]|nr:methylase [Chloroflexota bacterium]
MPRAPRKPRPQGQITRGKTARNRLRRVDNFLCLYDPTIIRQPDPPGQVSWYVDLGYGEEAFTALESAERLRRLNPALPVLGVEIDPERVQRALPFEDGLTRFRLGGFNLPLQPGESARLIRAFNVLRQYEENDVQEALLTLGERLIPGGLIIEGTSDPFGRIWVANLLRKQADGELWVEGLLFSTNFRWGFEPAIFQPRLPKNFIHRMLPGETIEAFMSAWKQAALATIAVRTLGLRQWFIAAALALRDLGWPVETRKRPLRQGYLLWKRSGRVRDGALFRDLPS